MDDAPMILGLILGFSLGLLTAGGIWIYYALSISFARTDKATLSVSNGGCVALDT